MFIIGLTCQRLVMFGHIASWRNVFSQSELYLHCQQHTPAGCRRVYTHNMPMFQTKQRQSDTYPKPGVAVICAPAEEVYVCNITQFSRGLNISHNDNLANIKSDHLKAVQEITSALKYFKSSQTTVAKLSQVII